MRWWCFGFVVVGGWMDGLDDVGWVGSEEGEGGAFLPACLSA